MIKLETLLSMGNMENENLGKNIRDIFDEQYKYIIPLYQRNFSWRREQIEQLLQDVFSAFKQNPNGKYYIGSLVVLKRSNGDFEVIDGQQRMTVLSLITKILGINKEPRLFYDSRPEVEEFFKAFYNSEDGNCNIDYSQTAHLKNAIDYIKEIDLDAENQTGKINDAKEIVKEGVSFYQYFENNVILVCVEIPQDTDVASYFEIMNNRGAQLQKHEILKSFLLNKIRGKSLDEFAKIWTACSQMDTPIQKLFETEDRRKYFGTNYDEFHFTGITELDIKNDGNSAKNLYDIVTESNLSSSYTGNSSEDNLEETDDETKYKSIIDFPNFLMHVFKVMFPNDNIQLNEKFLIETYKTVSNRLNPEVFIKNLFFCRTIFDRYIVKTFTDNNSEDGERWTLRKPRKKNDKWYYVDTFCKNDEEDKMSDEQSRIVKALSMLQVSFRTRIYKNWMFEILNWFANEKKQITISSDEYIQTLDKIILSNYKGLYNDKKKEFSQKIENANINKDNSYSLGTGTPHFLFNFIDYLYWVDSKNENSIFSHKKELKGFEFKYWNSVEHHMAKEWAKRNNILQFEQFIDNLGNLCLISKNANSRLSDRDVKEKVETFGNGNLGANRQIMYNMTKNDDNTYSWDENKIKAHYNELLELLSKRDGILNNQKE